MKTSPLFILFLFVCNFVFSQQKLDSSIPTDSIKVTKDSTIAKVAPSKWSIEIGAGISNGTRPYTEGYFTSIHNQLFNGFILNCYTVGGRYNFSDVVGVKMDLAFDRYINSKETKSKPFEVAQYRTSIQAVFNLNSFIKSINDDSRFNLLFRGGVHLAILKPISADYNKRVSNGDNYGGIVFGITPILRISKMTSIFFDLSSFSNYGQNLTWNGKHSQGSTNTDGQMYSATFGLSFALKNNKKLNDGAVNTSSLTSDEVTAIPVDVAVAADPTKTSVKIDTVPVPESVPESVPAAVPATTVSPEGFYAVGTEDQAKKLINDGYVAVYYNVGDDKPATNNSNEAIGFVLTYLRNNPTATVDIIGNTDQTGTVEFNEKLATARAQNLKDILIKSGVAPSRMKIISKGEDHSVDENSAEARSLVRKVIFTIKEQ